MKRVTGILVYWAVSLALLALVVAQCDGWK